MKKTEIVSSKSKQYAFKTKNYQKQKKLKNIKKIKTLQLGNYKDYLLNNKELESLLFDDDFKSLTNI